MPLFEAYSTSAYSELGFFAGPDIGNDLGCLVDLFFLSDNYRVVDVEAVVSDFGDTTVSGGEITSPG